ncbi:MULTISPECIES: PRD domain-containing protein [unclassified Breznakia]|uniref:PRD domain-containing protein n=1 Tax=unclassified Breznakia TaxID=2623764 RepID=UPI0024764BE3|nr:MULTISPECIES: PRD domain-containing protein [unclassified Breznakia]MDH6368167.1 beta-glucoside operon transcriptional antiterminator [Breznakia sp. PH1-1]MDH6405256.1 beta-glucoside operon transcriptional antiterminator [Breznakia sp. PF1-11]MDH6412970.1 beta-glucoside operon transcriptional antiterminator [Breznakia sp. PFB1-11]MDH6415332.1 beta-glucoside operon transcriptional antiterminator [Breznakia sp. PFB1-14]MDH6417636.1 beta-glucoside operon transcriptional antiterminator [Breznak
MKISRIYNNNVVVAVDGDNEYVVTGNGIGFNRKVHDDVDQNRVEKVYSFEDQQKKQFAELLNRTPIMYFQIAEAIATKAVNEMDIELSNQIFISLTDHLWYAADRKKRGLEIPNLMHDEIKSLYKDEYRIGLWSLRLIQANTGIQFPKDEASYIAMHIVNATVGNKVRDAKRIVAFVKDVQTIIENVFGISFSDESLDTSRLSTHLKFLAQHIFIKDTKEPLNLDQMYTLLINKHEKMELCVENIFDIVKLNYHYTLTKDELVYLMIHINKIVSI